MNDSERLAQQMDRALEGGAWHGPSWHEILEGVSAEAANHRPIPEAHTIAEIVLHATTWHDVVRRRMSGESPSVTDAQDWPAADKLAGDGWTRVQGDLFATGRALSEVVRAFPAERLHEKRPGLDDTWSELILGELQHMLYHGGQVGLLKKAMKPAAVPQP